MNDWESLTSASMRSWFSGSSASNEDEQLIEKMLDDTSVVTSHNRVNSKRITTQVRDVALAVLIHRHRGRLRSATG